MATSRVATVSEPLAPPGRASAQQALAVAARTVSGANAKAVKQGNLADLTVEEWLAVLAAYKYTCAYCRGTGALSLDHVVPLSGGGATTLRNVVPACRTCNSRKGARRWADVPERQAVERPLSVPATVPGERSCAWPACGEAFQPVRANQRFPRGHAACRLLDYQARCRAEPHLCRCLEMHHPAKPKKPRKKYRRHKKLCASDCWCKED